MYCVSCGTFDRNASSAGRSEYVLRAPLSAWYPSSRSDMVGEASIFSTESNILGNDCGSRDEKYPACGEPVSSGVGVQGVFFSIDLRGSKVFGMGVDFSAVFPPTFPYGDVPSCFTVN